MKIEFLGHAGFLLTGSVRIAVDPFLAGNPRAVCTPEELECDYIAVTHGHGDHASDVPAIAARTGAPIVAPFELSNIFQEMGHTASGGNPGGSIVFPFGSVTFTPAIHSSSFNGRYAGVACGLVIELDGVRFYHLGDTALFSDLELIGERYRPHVAAVPIGDYFTMDAVDGMRAAELVGAPRVIPVHFKTFPLLAQSIDGFAPHGVTVEEMEPGDTIEVSGS